jgi:hypothetical protein
VSRCASFRQFVQLVSTLTTGCGVITRSSMHLSLSSDIVVDVGVCDPTHSMQLFYNIFKLYFPPFPTFFDVFNSPCNDGVNMVIVLVSNT